MHIKQYLAVTFLAFFLLGCGGGGDPCGAQTEFFSYAFKQAAVTLKMGTSATIASEFSPESCRGDASFSLRSGTIPPGMALSNGNVVGTPTTAGEHKFRISLDGVDGYSSFGTGLVANTVTVTVTP
jgi:hypothetical protein